MADETKETKEVKAATKVDKKPKEVDKARFIQNRLLVLNTKSGARYKRDADRVVNANSEVAKNVKM